MKDWYFNLYLIPYSYLFSQGRNTENKKHFKYAHLSNFPLESSVNDSKGKGVLLPLKSNIF